jgi:hypothetical protein
MILTGNELLAEHSITTHVSIALCSHLRPLAIRHRGLDSLVMSYALLSPPSRLGHHVNIQNLHHFK